MTTEQDKPQGNNEPEATPVSDGVSQTAVDVSSTRFDDVADAVKSVTEVDNAKLRYYPLNLPMSGVAKDELDALNLKYAESVWDDTDKVGSSSKIRAHGSALGAMYYNAYSAGEYAEFFNRPEAKYCQKVTGSNGVAYIRNAGASKTDQTIVTGNTALDSIRKSLGLGTAKTIPLVASCFTVQIGAFSQSDVISLAVQLQARRLDTGYNTNGYHISGSDSAIQSIIIGFILSHVEKTNIKGWVKGEIDIMLNLLDIRDHEALMSGALEAIYPSGYPIAHRCKHEDTDACSYEVPLKVDLADQTFHWDSLINFAKTHVYDASRIPSEVSDFMGAGSGTHTVEEIEKMQALMADTTEVVAEFGESTVTLVIKTPKTSEYINAGLEWIARISEMTDKVMAMDGDGDEDSRVKARVSYIREFESSTALRKNSCWVDKIKYHDPTADDIRVIEDSDTIARVLSDMSGDMDAQDVIEKAINEYKMSCKISACGVFDYACPSCGKQQAEGADVATGMLPINVLGYFFGTTVWRRALRTTKRRLATK